MNICIIPARGGSQRIPGKNIKQFHGKPIIAYSIEVAKESGLFDKIVVSTDDHEIAQVAYENGADIQFREADMSVDNVGTQAVAKYVICRGHDRSSMFDRACVIYPCSPMLDKKDLLLADERLSRRISYCLSVGDSPLHDAGNFYYGWADEFVLGSPIFGMDTVMIPLPKERVCDINTPEDWVRAEKMYEALHGAD
jgi:CMP-N-acetylneuraminic acid synthetase